jgi:hypothetical protein
VNREDLEHIIRAAADITNEYEFVVVGSQSILGPIPLPRGACPRKQTGPVSLTGPVRAFNTFLDG